MADYDTLKGFSSMSELDINEIVVSNLIMFFDWGLVDKGAFNNITIGAADIRGSQKANLKIANEKYYSSGRIWETFSSNLSYESGTTISEPIPISGVYVNGTLYGPNHATYGHYIDYNNGRVVFNSSLPLNSTVKMEYSTKTFDVCQARESPVLREIQFNHNNISTSHYNQVSSGDWSVHGSQRVQLPLIGFEYTRDNREAYELGSAAFKIQHDITCYVVGETEGIVKKAMGIISAQKEKTIFALDMNLMARSGLFPLDYRGALRSGAVTYRDLAKESTGLRYGKLTILDTIGQNGQYLNPNVYYGSVTLKTEIIG